MVDVDLLTEWRGMQFGEHCISSLFVPIRCNIYWDSYQNGGDLLDAAQRLSCGSCCG